jgi:hypothetical protein
MKRPEKVMETEKNSVIIIFQVIGGWTCIRWDSDVVDVVYVNIVTLSLGCVGVGEGAKGEQSIANQGQEWMGIRAMSKIAGSPSK